MILSFNKAFRHLLWKEGIILLLLMAFMVVLGGFLVVGSELDDGGQAQPRQTVQVIGLLVLGLAVASGSVMFSAEKEYKTDLLLRRLAIPPAAIWQAKMVTALAGLLVLTIILTGLAMVVDLWTSFLLGNSFRWFGASEVVWPMLVWVVLAVEALLFSTLCSSLIRYVLATLISSVSLLVIGMVVIPKALGYQTLLEELTIGDAGFWLVNALVLAVLLAANAMTIPRWISGRTLGWTWPTQGQVRTSRVMEWGHELSPAWRFVTRCLWIEFQQGWLIWLGVAGLQILLVWGEIQSHRTWCTASLGWFLVPLLMGLASYYRDRQPERAHFWYCRGVSASRMWITKTAIWGSVTFLILLLALPTMEDMALSWDHRYRLERPLGVFIPQLVDSWSNPWVYAVTIFLISQCLVAMLPQVILAVVLALVASLYLAGYMQLQHYSAVPLWATFLPLLVAIVYLVITQTYKMIRNIPLQEKSRLQSWAIPVAVLISISCFFGYRLVSIPNITFEQQASLEQTGKLLAAPDQEYSQKFFQLLNSLPNWQKIQREISETVQGEVGLGEIKTAEQKLQREQQLYAKYLQEDLEAHGETVRQIADLLQKQYKSGGQMQLDLISLLDPLRDRDFDAWAELEWMVFDKLYRIVTPERYHTRIDEPGPLSPAEVLRLSWNLDLAIRYSDASPIYSHPFINRSGGYLLGGDFWIELAHESDPQTLRELAREAEQRLEKLPSLSEIMQLQHTRVLDQLAHDNQLLWMYLPKLFSLNRDVYSGEAYQNLSGQIMWSRITIFPSEKIRAQHLALKFQGRQEQTARELDACLEQNLPLQEPWSLIHFDPMHEIHYGTDDIRSLNRQLATTWAVKDLQASSYENFEKLYLERIQNQDRMTTLRLALLAYQREHDTYPPELKALVPDYLERLPLDIWTAEPFEYIGPEFTGTLVSKHERPLSTPMIWSRGWDKIELEPVTEDGMEGQYQFVAQRADRNIVTQMTKPNLVTQFGVVYGKFLQDPLRIELPTAEQITLGTTVEEEK